MKTLIIITIGSLVMLLSGCTAGSCGGCGNFYNNCSGYYDYYNRCGGNPGCGSAYMNECQCTDPSCYNNFQDCCLSSGNCCESFGNIGAR